ncbi:chorismate synthase [Peptoclostridium litorale DSM 5388]|uniref:Chorismate synthase n=1 Tax=Peptoclostridium litorale DSM 5388 TaxID=1121324 RepID=A0A069RCK0_PEPLI|nr:chorismate synthase [Peptoclostridium litorale]KDR94493.1 chorismate synthase AroC [Peptoclostridium litorale DSM 5388]SIO35785.1 chorismate synthase [Peptoclostridium litorale DSM 5388]
MSATWGRNFKISIFGESHGTAIGAVIDGLPGGVELDIDNIKMHMKRRAPGKNKLSTPRAEGDEFEILSGYFNGKTTGTPLAVMIRNKDRRSNDYEKTKSMLRPGHADYTGMVRYGGFNDYRGGGHFSGRLTAPVVFAGAIAQQILQGMGISVMAHVKSIGSVKDDDFCFENIDPEIAQGLKAMEIPVLDNAKADLMRQEIIKAKDDLDSVGGVIECAVTGVRAGVGDPFFDSVESNIAHIMFSVPAVKGIEFGAGFDISNMKGSQANDEPYIKDGKILHRKNNNGGIVGGITNGMPIVFKAAIKPTPSIGRPQSSVDIEKMSEVELEIEGRHDPCIVQRAIPVIEAGAAIAALDMIMERGECF